MDYERKELLYKILVVGDIGVGKTSFIKRYVHNIFSPHYKSTIGVDFALKVIKWDDNTNVRLQLWDIAGQERFGGMTRVYYKESVAAFVVFDITRISTFDAVKKWKTDIDSKATLSDSDEPIPVILLCNKIDLDEGVGEAEDKEWDKSNEEMDIFCKEYGFVSWFNISSKNGFQVELAVNALGLSQKYIYVQYEHKYIL
jgi:Ras-related protein Rab-32